MCSMNDSPPYDDPPKVVPQPPSVHVVSGARPESEADVLERTLAAALEEFAPPKVEGGSPARAQWLTDVLSVQRALFEMGGGRAFAAYWESPR